MHAFWLVLTHDLLEDRRIDVVIIKTFPLCYFKMAESFENLDDILAKISKKVFSRLWTVTINKRKKENHVSLSETTWQNYLSGRSRTRLR